MEKKMETLIDVLIYIFVLFLVLQKVWKVRLHNILISININLHVCKHARFPISAVNLAGKGGGRCMVKRPCFYKHQLELLFLEQQLS